MLHLSLSVAPDMASIHLDDCPHVSTAPLGIERFWGTELTGNLSTASASCTDWICFIVLDIGNPIVFGLPVAAVSNVDGAQH